MTHTICSLPRWHPLYRIDQVRQVLLTDRVSRRVINNGWFQVGSRIDFDPTLHLNPREECFHSFQPLQLRDTRSLPGLPERASIVDTELRDVDHALVPAEFFQ